MGPAVRRTAVRTLAFLALVSALLLGSKEAVGATLTASWEDNSGSTAYTRIERRLDSDGVFTELADALPGQTVYADTTVNPGSRYCYRVFAWVVDGVSPYTEEVCAGPITGGIPLVVAKAGNGVGSVTSSPIGINCGSTCSTVYSAASVITLMATPAAGSTFAGWSGSGCAGTAPCMIVGNVPISVTARFTAAPASVTPPIASPPLSDYLRWIQSLPPGSATNPNDPILRQIYERQTGRSASEGGFNPDYLAWIRNLPPGSATDPNDGMLQSIYASQTGGSAKPSSSVASGGGAPSFEQWINSLPAGSSKDPNDPLLKVYYESQFPQ